MNRWELHLKEWKNCKRCPLSKTRQQVVFTRGTIPCDVLFIGEAPGHAEDSNGEPFCGETGHLLQDEIINIAVPKDVRYALINLLGCIPLGEDGVKLNEPDEDDVRACAPRIIDFVEFAKPKLLILVGKHAQHYFNTQYKHRIRVPDSLPRIGIYHPSYINRKPDTRTVLIDEATIDIQDAIKQYVKRGANASTHT